MLALVDLNDPLLWAAFIGWILSVVLHEFGHGIVAYWGGDWTIRERGGLSLNPLQYIDPVFSIVFPAIIFLLGGVPLPGGATYIRRDLIRSRGWNVAVSLAGPGMNFLLFLLLALPMHPAIGWISVGPGDVLDSGVSNFVLFLGALAWLQMLSVLFNLVPVPPLDGFQAIAEFMDQATREKIMRAQQAMFFIFFLIIWNAPAVGAAFHGGVENTMRVLGFDHDTILFFRLSYARVLFGPF